MRMRMWLAAALLALAVAGAPARGGAATITLVPASPTVGASNPIDVDVVISGLGEGAPPTVAAFDLDVTFDAAVLQLVSVDFGWDVFPDAGLSAWNLLATPPRVDLAGASLFDDATLDAYQPASFVLATLHFFALTPGVSPLAITQAVLAATGGGSLPSALVGTSVEVLVPEPGTVSLLLVGLAGLSAARSRA